VNQSEITFDVPLTQYDQLVSFFKKRRVLAPDPPAADQEPGITEIPDDEPVSEKTAGTDADN